MTEARQNLGEAFIRHPMAEAALKDLEDFYALPPSADHAWAGLLTGPTGAGKSAVLRAFCARRKPTSNPNLVQPIVCVELPDKCNTRTLSDVLLIALKDPGAGKRASIPDIQRAAIAHLKRQKVKCVIFDEAQHATGPGAYQAANFFKHVMNNGVSVLLSGLPSSAELLDNEQLEGRGMISAELRAFNWWDAEDKRALLGVLKKLQGMLRSPTKGFDLTDADWAWRFAFASQGLMRPIVKLLILTDMYAQQQDPPFITKDVLRRAWNKLPKKERRSKVNPFELATIPATWMTAPSTAGERN